MIFSPTRLEDMKFRAELLNDVEWLFAHGYEELAKSVDEVSESLKVRINIHDYSKQDAWLEIENKITNRSCPRK